MEVDKRQFYCKEGKLELCNVPVKIHFTKLPNRKKSSVATIAFRNATYDVFIETLQKVLKDGQRKCQAFFKNSEIPRWPRDSRIVAPLNLNGTIMFCGDPSVTVVPFLVKCMSQGDIME